MMTSAVMSSQSAGSLYIQTQERSDVVEEEIQSQATVHQQIVLGDSDSRWEIQSQAFHDQRLDNQLQTYRYNQLDIQTQAIFIQSRATVDPVEGYSVLHIQSIKNSAEAQSSSRHESAAKQLTIYESWMSTAEQERCTYLERRQFGLDKRRKDLNLQSNGHIQTEAIYAKATPLKKVDDVGERVGVAVRLSQKICCTVHQQRENEQKDEAIDRH
ncbi:hypothetical protein F511_01715 [Dorcoceras hygrometricum]|nr:hypothetical protein F511_01715 [Dorcoceras hygrometricum]